MTTKNQKKTTAKKELKNLLSLSTQDLYNFLNNKLWIVSTERLHKPASGTDIHQVRIQKKFIYPAGEDIYLLPLSSIVSLKVKGEAVADTLQHIFGVPAGMISLSGSRKKSTEPNSAVAFQETSSLPVQRFRRFRRALLYAFVWNYKHAELKKQDTEAYLQELLQRLNAGHLASMPLLNQLCEILAEVAHPPATLGGNSLEASSIHVQRWYWFAQFLRDQLFQEEGKMDEVHRQWFLQFKTVPYRIEPASLPPLFEPLRKVILGYLLFLRIYDAASPQEERRIFEQEIRQPYGHLPYNELEQIYLYALLFKGFFTRQADNYFIASSGQHVFAYIEYQALLLAKLTSHNAKTQNSLCKSAIKELLEAQKEENTASHVLAYYEGINPLLKKRGVLWLVEQWHEVGKQVEWDKLSPEEKKQTLAKLNKRLHEQKQVLLVRNNESQWFFRNFYPHVSWQQLKNESLLLHALSHKKWPLPENTVNLLYLKQQEDGNTTLHGSLCLSTNQTISIYSTRTGIEQVSGLALFNSGRLKPLDALLPQAKVLLIAIDNCLLSHLAQLWLAHWIDALKPEKVICVNLTTISPQNQVSLFEDSIPLSQPKKSSRKQPVKTAGKPTPPLFDMPDADEQKLREEMIVRKQLKKLFPKGASLYHLNLAEENFELIRLLRPLLRSYRWYETALIYMGHQQPIPAKLSDALLRAQSDLIIYDEQMRYMFYNL